MLLCPTLNVSQLLHTARIMINFYLPTYYTHHWPCICLDIVLISMAMGLLNVYMYVTFGRSSKALMAALENQQGVQDELQRKVGEHISF